MKFMLAVHQQYLPQFLGDEELARLRAISTELKIVEPNELSAEDWRKAIADFSPDALLACWGTRGVPEDAPANLRYVANLCGGVRTLVTRAMLERGVMVSNWGTIHAPAVAEHALLLTLCALRKITRWSQVIHQDHDWASLALSRVNTLVGKRVGIHGFGSVARELLKYLQPFNCQVRVYSAGVPEDFIRSHGVTPASSLAELFSSSQVLIDAEALTPASRHSVTEDLLRMLPRGGVFVNVGRGAVVDEVALIRVASEGWLEVAIDVYETEPPPADSPLRGLRNVTMTPHIAGPTGDMLILCGRRAVENLAKFARGQKPDGLITPEMYDRAT